LHLARSSSQEVLGAGFWQFVAASKVTEQLIGLLSSNEAKPFEQELVLAFIASFVT
jgi:hypothetical protein